MKQTKWNEWIQTNQADLSDATNRFLQEAQLHAVQETQITFVVSNTPVTFKKLSASAWTMPSSLFVPYGSLSNLFTGFNLLLDENQAA